MYTSNLNLNLTLLQEDEDLEAIAASVPPSEPYILAVGNSVQDLIQFAVIAECQIVTEPASVSGAILDLMSTYFAFLITTHRTIMVFLFSYNILFWI